MTNQAFPSEDGNFKRGAFKPVAILIGVLLVGGAAAFAFLGVQHEAATLTKDEVNKEVRDIQMLPKADQLPRWRKWADVETEPRLEQEAFVHLAWAKDQASIPSMIKGLASPDHAVRGTAAMALVDFGSPAADNAKPVLLKALLEADESD
jgi:HEAT repeat protein